MIRHKCRTSYCLVYLDSPGYCPAHVKVKVQAEKARQSIYDQRDRDKAMKAFYNSKAWRDSRASYIALHPLCAMCQREPTYIVHHTTPAKQLDYAGKLSHKHLQGLCASCHSKYEALVAKGVDIYRYVDPLGSQQENADG